MMISVRTLSCQFDDRLLFRDLSFECRPGEAIWIKGPNGVGKTSLLKIIAGLVPPSEGDVLIENRALGVSDFQYVGVEKGLFSFWTAAEHLAYWGALRGVKRKACEDILEKLGLQEFGNIEVKKLSYGQKQRLHLGRLFIEKTDLWLLDEPAQGLDEEGQALLAGWMKDHSKQGGMMIYTSHHALDIVGGKEIEL